MCSYVNCCVFLSLHCKIDFYSFSTVTVTVQGKATAFKSDNILFVRRLRGDLIEVCKKLLKVTKELIAGYGLI